MLLSFAQSVSLTLDITIILFSRFLSFLIYLDHRHGVMLVGDPMSAKTKAYMLLAETLTTLAERKIPEHHEFRVNIDHPSKQQLDVLGRRCKVRSSTPSRSRWLSSTAVLTRPHMSGAMVSLPPRSGDHRQSLSYLKLQRLCQKKIELYMILDPAEGLGILGLLGQNIRANILL